MGPPITRRVGGGGSVSIMPSSVSALFAAAGLTEHSTAPDPPPYVPSSEVVARAEAFFDRMLARYGTDEPDCG